MLIQAAGAVAVLLSTLALGKSMGPAVQGVFSNVKSEVEFLSAFAMLGLPQALFFYVRSGRMDLQRAQRWAFASGGFALVLGMGAAWVRHGQLGAFACLMGLAIATCVLHGQFRVLLLNGRTALFNVITAAPQVLVFVAVLLAIAFAHSSASVAPPDRAQWLLAFAAVYSLAALLAWWWLRGIEQPASVGRAGWREIMNYGAASWLTASLATAAILGVQHWVEGASGRVVLGQFTMSMVLTQIPLTPINYALPILLRHWTGRPQIKTALLWSALLFAALLLVAALIYGISFWWPDFALGQAYAGIAKALAVLMVGVSAEAAARVLMAHAGASGKPWVAVHNESVRCGVLLLCWACGMSAGLMPICIAWAAGAVAAAGMTVWHSLRHLAASKQSAASQTGAQP